MKNHDVQARLTYARAGVAVLRTLRMVGKTINYREFAMATGLIHDGEQWEPHRQQIHDILNLIAAAERQPGVRSKAVPLALEMVVAESNMPDHDSWKTSRIVSD
jgi:uncharacterized protein (UPF0147 family)